MKAQSNKGLDLEEFRYFRCQEQMPFCVLLNIVMIYIIAATLNCQKHHTKISQRNMSGTRKQFREKQINNTRDYRRFRHAKMKTYCDTNWINACMLLDALIEIVNCFRFVTCIMFYIITHCICYYLLHVLFIIVYTW